MTKEEYVSSIFVLMHKLRNTKRKGWYDKNIQRERVESVAEHIYGCQMLAYAIKSEFEYDVDINKVILMLAVHEIGETIIGDITPDDMPSSKKTDYEHEAVRQLVKLIPNGKFLEDLFNEFEEGKTKEARFAFQIDKAECDLQARLYEQDGSFEHEYKKYLFTKEWIDFDRKTINFDENFDSLLEYATNNEMQVTDNSDNKLQNVVSFYTATNSLKDIQRTGERNIKQDHFGSIAEHIYSVQMLALAIYLVYGTEVDIARIISIISKHELGEIKIGDISALLKSENDKSDEWKAAVSIASILSNKGIILDDLSKFNESKTRECIFAKYCDKLAPDIISKIYDQLGLIDLNNQENNPLLKHPIVARYLKTGKSFSEMWILYGQEVYGYQEPFISISNYALNNELTESYSQKIKVNI